jgi:NAD(P)-dependent dehydrogenase (short-subunit alcohol dehydrogenase family)
MAKATQSVRGRTALVTGANRGIGKAIVEALVARGAAKVYAAARKPETLATLVAESKGRVVALGLDVTDDAQVRAAATAAGDVDLLINNAGIVGHSFAAFEDPAWVDAGRQEFDTNVLGMLRMTQAFAPTLARQGGGTVVNILSVAALVNFPIFLVYAATKAAGHSITQGSRVALAAQGTHVVGVYPGPVDTEMGARLPNKESPERVAEAILDGLEAGEEEIFPDAFAIGVGATYAKEPKALERNFAAAVG